TNPDFGPAVAFDGAGHAVVAWTKSTDGALGANATLDAAFARRLEIAFAVVDAHSGAVVNTGTLKHDDVLDFGPQLAGAGSRTRYHPTPCATRRRARPTRRTGRPRSPG